MGSKGKGTLGFSLTISNEAERHVSMTSIIVKFVLKKELMRRDLSFWSFLEEMRRGKENSWEHRGLLRQNS